MFSSAILAAAMKLASDHNYVNWDYETTDDWERKQEKKYFHSSLQLHRIFPQKFPHPFVKISFALHLIIIFEFTFSSIQEILVGVESEKIFINFLIQLTSPFL